MGEPFIVKDFVNILRYASALKPCLVLTNGTEPVLKRLRQIETLAAQPYPVAFRISIDYPDSARHDAGRGSGSFEKAWQGMRELYCRGFKVSLARQMDAGEDGDAVTDKFPARCSANIDCRKTRQSFRSPIFSRQAASLTFHTLPRTA